ncbi:unnamed protein product [Rangifer tarandus platyrhynchus]|uniref:Secreted protein n=2 Tax=Rangifer tarandus platyrhynchus TaxID=3082113 RepID=A0ABN8ZZ55_RANTA|nr:unnamed protein product [Rangifer tarandus platyrhynchus]
MTDVRWGQHPQGKVGLIFLAWLGVAAEGGREELAIYVSCLVTQFRHGVGGVFLSDRCHHESHCGLASCRGVCAWKDISRPTPPCPDPSLTCGCFSQLENTPTSAGRPFPGRPPPIF